MLFPFRRTAGLLATLTIVAATIMTAGIRPARAADVPTFVWIEGEKYESLNVPVGDKKPGNIAGWGRPEFLSDAKWLQVGIDAENLDRDLPKEGVVVRYAFTAPKAGKYDLWDRIGYEFVRSPFQWRVDGGAWSAPVSPDQLTTDLMELATWTEVAWLKLGSADLKAGPHTVEIKLDRSLDEKNKPRRILYASDALCLTTGGAFRPNGKYKPGEVEPRTEQPTTFAVPQADGQGGSRVLLPLTGVWEICRDDEQLPGPVAEPIKALPSDPFWKTIAVPGDKNTLRPDLVFAHRVWYRTKVNVPADYAGRSFVLTFPQNNLNTTVFVNGVYCGFNKNPLAKFDIDITRGVKPGQVNEVWVGIRDAWYGYSASPTDPMKLRRRFNIPLEFTSKGFQDLAYPVWNGFMSGIIDTPTLTVAGGPAYAADVFCKPSVSKKEMAAEITVANPTGKAVSGEVLWEAVDDATGQVAKTFAPAPFKADASGQTTLSVSGAWADPKLWWPDPEPALYRLRTTVVVGGKAVDTRETLFGFREWGWKGRLFTLNGQPWKLWGDLTQGRNPQDWLANYRKNNARTMRLSGVGQGGINWMGMEPGKALEFFDRSGVTVRRSGPLDGEAIGYMAIENDPELQKKYNSPIKVELLDNCRDQFLQQVRGERNHPSIQIWSLENEFLYINCINLYADKMDLFEAEITKWSDAVLALDPTRPTMVDGGGATKANTLPVHGDHYVQGAFSRYPALAYESQPEGGGRGRWKWDEQRPRFMGEDFFATGIKPADYAAIGGEASFLGKTYARPAVARMYRILTEGYRWSDQSAWQFWLATDTGLPTMYASQAPVAVFCRQWDSAFLSGAKVRRTLGIFNDSRDAAPITLTRTLTVAGREAEKVTKTYTVAPGTSEKFDVTLPVPAISGPRAEGTWTLALTQNGSEVYRDERPISVLNPRKSEAGATVAGIGRVSSSITSPPIPLSEAERRGRKTQGRSSKVRNSTARYPLSASERGMGGEVISSRDLLVYDPAGTVAGYLKAQAVSFTPIASLDALPKTGGRVLIVGKDALSPADASSPRLAAWASSGRGVLLLEQKNPLHGIGLPAAMETGKNEGHVAFPEDDTHPAFRNLRESDFFTWGGDRQVLVRDAYEKPTGGGKSLMQCLDELGSTALAEIPAGDGVLLVSQLLIGENLPRNAVAQQLFTNLLDYAASYKRTVRPVNLVAGADSKLAGVLGQAGVTYTAATGPLEALARKGGIAVIEATPGSLQTLAANKSKVDTFTKGGGWIVFNNLTPEGLASYNKVVGWNHMIRPFRRERVSFPVKKNPLTAGLSTGDIVLSSGQRINGFTSDEYTADDEFSYVVDYDDVAPFLIPPDVKYWGLTDASNDHNPLNAVNGYTSQDWWALAFMIWGGDPNKKPTFPFKLPQKQEIRRIEWTGNPIYAPTEQIDLTFDGANPVRFDTEPNGEPQTFDVPSGHAGSDILLTINKFKQIGAQPLPGIDNVRLFAARPESFYKRVRPLLNIGSMLEYADPSGGPGGIVLCNVRFQDRESVPANGPKKRNILATLLRNLQAPVGGGGGVIVGAANLTYAPIDLSKQANQYRSDRGWFGDAKYTFSALPTGKQTFGGVPFTVYDFPTSPVPTAVMLGGPGVPNSLPEEVRGIPVNRKADALFFLHTARIDRERDDRDLREKKRYEVARYVITYTDGQKAEVPLIQDVNIGSYRQKGTPVADLPQAPVAWSAPFPNTNEVSAAYLLQWNNPRPQVAIQSIDLEYGKDKGRAIPALLAVTAATKG